MRSGGENSASTRNLCGSLRAGVAAAAQRNKGNNPSTKTSGSYSEKEEYTQEVVISELYLAH